MLILNWNGCDDTIACVRSLRGSTHKEVRIVVVDNGSTDDSVRTINREFSDVTLLQSGANLGYAGGNNFGLKFFLRELNDDFVFVLNNDIVVHPSAISELVAAASRLPHGSILGPKINLYGSDRIWSLGGTWDDASCAPLSCEEGKLDSERKDKIEQREFVIGCAMLLSRSTIAKLGGFDERFFLVHEECDFCFRAKNAGVDTYCIPDAKIWHKVGTSFQNEATAWYYWSRNRLLFAEIHLTFRQRIRLYVTTVVEILAPPTIFRTAPGLSQWKNAYWIVRREGLWSRQSYRHPLYKARLHGLRDYLLRRFGHRPGLV